jgi:hypothetical protein
MKPELIKFRFVYFGLMYCSMPFGNIGAELGEMYGRATIVKLTFIVITTVWTGD